MMLETYDEKRKRWEEMEKREDDPVADERRTDAPNVEPDGACPDCGGRLYSRDEGWGWTWFCADCPHTKEMSNWE